MLGLFIVWLCVFACKHIHTPIIARRPLTPYQEKKKIRILHFSYPNLDQKYKIMKTTVDEESSELQKWVGSN